MAPLNKFAQRGQNLLARKMGHRGLLTIRERGGKKEREREREGGGGRKEGVEKKRERKKERRRRKVSLKVTWRAV